MTLRESLVYRPVELAFGTSGLRGLVSDMTDLECYINATGFLHFLQDADGLKPDEIIYLAGDLRDSTPRIMAVMVAALQNASIRVVNCGLIPTPAVAYYALQHQAPCIMVTGSHIPANRNGIKFYKREGEVLKEDEGHIKACVAAVRQELYEQNLEQSLFDEQGSLKQRPTLSAETKEAAQAYANRYTETFGGDCLGGKQIVFYQHSAVGRDLLVDVLRQLGADVVAVERADQFIPIDSENVTAKDRALFKKLSQDYPSNFAIVSTDGDSDRPFVVDETGTFHRGDVLGLPTTELLGAKFVAIPVSANDAVDMYCEQHGITKISTKIGSPYVVIGMAQATPDQLPSVGWEVNGGFMLCVDTTINGQPYKALPTRDAALPIIATLVMAARQGITVSELFARLPKRYTGGALIDDVPPTQIEYFRSIATNRDKMMQLANLVFGTSQLGEVTQLDITDGLRLRFASNDVIHLRPSGNAPQFRVYSNADSQARADELATRAVAPNGYIEQLLNALTDL